MRHFHNQRVMLVRELDQSHSALRDRGFGALTPITLLRWASLSIGHGWFCSELPMHLRARGFPRSHPLEIGAFGGGEACS